MLTYRFCLILMIFFYEYRLYDVFLFQSPLFGSNCVHVSLDAYRHFFEKETIIFNQVAVSFVLLEADDGFFAFYSEGGANAMYESTSAFALKKGLEFSFSSSSSSFLFFYSL